MPVPAARRLPFPAIALLLLASAGIAAAWALVALVTGRQCSWMALVAALDAAIVLRITGARAGTSRACAAMAATAFAIALANWWIAAGQVGRSLGLMPWASSLRLGPDYAWTLASLANRPVDLAWIAAALLLAAIAGR
ncbi:hypothetical protein [Pseudoluteimonas lycopersici]|uniref:hypothetical protein n=1 Tax=Pseudoluteimonas lycopersici TaxID=1324796 RepID=UPI001FE470F4|nr:hypothetical protein [Lysobacter lycopersici]